jgi:flagellar protein FliO/FliZ
MRMRANALHAIALAGAVMALTPPARAEARPGTNAAEAPPADGVPPSIAAPPAADTMLSEVSAAPPAEGGTPLALRPSKPLELAHEPPPSSIGWKLVALAVILGGAAYYARKKLWVKPSEDGQLTVVRRATVGFRTELLVVNVEGQRLLLGVTPNSIQSLAVLDADEPSPVVLDRPAPPQSLGDRFAAMLHAAENQSTGQSTGQSASRVQSATAPATAAPSAAAPADKPAPRARKPRAASTASAANTTKITPNPAREPGAAADEEPEMGSQARGLLALRRPR